MAHPGICPTNTIARLQAAFDAIREQAVRTRAAADWSAVEAARSALMAAWAEHPLPDGTRIQWHDNVTGEPWLTSVVQDTGEHAVFFLPSGERVRIAAVSLTGASTLATISYRVVGPYHGRPAVQVTGWSCTDGTKAGWGCPIFDTEAVSVERGPKAVPHE